MIHAYRGVLPKRCVTDKDLELIYRSAKGYISLAAEYRAARGA